MIALAAIATLVVAVLALPRRSALVPAPAADSTSEVSDSTAQTIVAAPSAAQPSTLTGTATAIAKPDAATHPEGESVKKTPAERPLNLAAAPSGRPTALSPVVETHDKTASESPRVHTAPNTTVTAPTPAPPATETDALSQVTITGCLETGANENQFRLTDTEGANAPKARSWRTGFLKKRSAPMDLIGAPDLGALQKQVGRRVAVTGVQTNRELKVGSVRVVSPSCN
jgi:hypothetical protein